MAAREVDWHGVVWSILGVVAVLFLVYALQSSSFSGFAIYDEESGARGGYIARLLLAGLVVSLIGLHIAYQYGGEHPGRKKKRKSPLDPREPLQPISSAQRALRWFHDRCEEEHTFQLKDGGALQSVGDLHASLDGMPEGVFNHHVTAERNDFARWVRDVFQDESLALDLLETADTASMIQAIHRRKELEESLHHGLKSLQG